MRRWALLTLACLILIVHPTSAETRMNMSYLYFGQPADYLNEVTATHNTLTAVTPNYFDVTDGGVITPTWKIDQRFIDEMHRRGIQVTPFISNHWNNVNGIALLSDAQQDLQIERLVNFINQYQLDGVNLDIEGVGAGYRAAFSTFVAKLKNRLGSKQVSVAVAANPNGWTTGWHGFYDYVALANVADYILIMAYDEAWQGSSAGPVSSIGFFQRSLAYAQNLGVANDKIVMGLPFYGRLWKVDGLTTDQISINGVGVSNVRVASLMQKYFPQMNYDEEKQSPYAKFTIPAGQSESISGANCTEGHYVLWFENERSYKKKLRLIHDAGIRGAGSWSLYQETSDTWDYFVRWLNGTFYRDVADGWWAEDAIMEAADRGWMTGLTATDFAPLTPLTRAQAATVFMRYVTQALNPSTTPPFVDIATHWAKDAIVAAYQLGLVQGIDATHFKPDATLTRAEMATLLTRLQTLQQQGTTTP
jgi:spore germination protein YaaH